MLLFRFSEQVVDTELLTFQTQNFLLLYELTMKTIPNKAISKHTCVSQRTVSFLNKLVLNKSFESMIQSIQKDSQKLLFLLNELIIWMADS